MVTKPKSELVPTQTSALFELGDQPPHGVSKTFSHSGALGVRITPTEPKRGGGVPPLWVSPSDRADEWEHEFLRGADLMGFDPTPQQWLLADALNAHHDDGEPLASTTAVCVPRRAGKTTTLLATALGRAAERPNYVVLFTAQSGTKARDRFLAMARTLERRWPNEAERGFKILKGAGHQVVEFTNGSFLQVVPPKQESFRGDEGDLIILDEAQEHDAEVSGELLGAILPVMDTRPGAQLVVAGTAGEHRSGLFWDTLEEGRTSVRAIRAGQEPESPTGICEYAASDQISAPDLLTDGQKDWSKAEPLVTAAHPGVGTLTTVAKMRERFAKLPLPQFLREYLGVWPEDYSRSAIDAKAWRDAGLDFEDRPADVVFAFDVAPEGTTAAIAAAWRVEGEARVEIVWHEPLSDRLVTELTRLASTYRTTVGHDTVGAVLAEAEALGRKRPKPRTRPIVYRDVGAACATFMKDLMAGKLHHFDQPELNAAAAGAAKRPLGENAWGWGRKASGDTDITPLVAATIALRTYDTTPRRESSRIVSSRTLRRAS
ncbi:terminase large subunit domain-containing protein [Curtobacterium flaccumfaciens]|uniref:terminase large subunit domain-containing protein n=1 Tax=Curtobacterium flaccumfaciens TaxID=2035 RepID=UPI002657B7B5|nr:terminase family protein [Curtobacterium flaccumfaciens]MCS0491182.1 hypothetical protein [Curtobacterium flaccumfaciens pv. betae]